MKLSLVLASLVVSAGAVAAALRCSADEGTPAQEAPATRAADDERLGPGPEPVDRWNPARGEAVEPAYGGTLRVHIESLPPSLNTALVNVQNARNTLQEVHATLVRRDWESWKFVGELATRWDVADTLVTKDGTVRYGEVAEVEGKLALRENGKAAGTSLDPDDVARIERGTVITFHLREGVRWHDGHAFDAEDVLFSWRIAANPEVRCDWVRPYLTRIQNAEVLDRLTVRFYFKEQYFNTLALFVDNFCILPRHLYDLRDPEHPRHDANASDAACAKEINDNPHNTQWVGLGPYRVTSYSQQGIEAERFEDFFDPANGGWFDRIVWRHIPGDEAAFQALLNGELDFTLRISSDQYFGAAMQQPLFTESFCKGYFYLGQYNFVPWNMRRPELSDVRVRKALAHAMDLEGYVQTVAHGLAKLPTGPQCYFGPSYDHTVQRLPFDLARATDLFADAGWYDRDGDGVLDKDGQPFELEMIIQGGNVAAEVFARMFQESLARIGAKLVITPLDSATYFKRISDRDFDAGIQGWSVDVTENDPLQIWGSGSAVKGGSNHAGVIDPHVDDLIARGARELDDEKRWGLWRELHRYLYEEIQPYLYVMVAPRKFALAKGIRGVQLFKLTPGYALRRWYFPAGTPGTRPTRTPPAPEKK